ELVGDFVQVEFHQALFGNSGGHGRGSPSFEREGAAESARIILMASRKVARKFNRCCTGSGTSEIRNLPSPGPLPSIASCHPRSSTQSASTSPASTGLAGGWAKRGMVICPYSRATALALYFENHMVLSMPPPETT